MRVGIIADCSAARSAWKAYRLAEVITGLGHTVSYWSPGKPVNALPWRRCVLSGEQLPCVDWIPAHDALIWLDASLISNRMLMVAGSKQRRCFVIANWSDTANSAELRQRLNSVDAVLCSWTELANSLIEKHSLQTVVQIIWDDGFPLTTRHEAAEYETPVVAFPIRGNYCRSLQPADVITLAQFLRKHKSITAVVTYDRRSLSSETWAAFQTIPRDFKLTGRWRVQAIRKSDRWPEAATLARADLAVWLAAAGGETVLLDGMAAGAVPVCYDVPPASQWCLNRKNAMLIPCEIHYSREHAPRAAVRDTVALLNAAGQALKDDRYKLLRDNALATAKAIREAFINVWKTLLA